MYPDKRITRMTSLKGYETLLLAPNSTTHVCTYETFPPFTQKRFNLIFFCIRTSGLTPKKLDALINIVNSFNDVSGNF